MTVGELARRTGMSAKAIRQFEGLGLIYSAGRSEANYRLFEESAIWCVQVIGHLRSLGLTIKEIQQLAAVYIDRPGEPIGPAAGRAPRPRRTANRAAARGARRHPAPDQRIPCREQRGALRPLGSDGRRPAPATGRLTFPPG
jgi:DNA-binding transcriptional MerR regulator